MDAEETGKVRSELDFIDITFKEWMWAKDGLGLRLGSLDLLAYANIYKFSAHGGGVSAGAQGKIAERYGVSRDRLRRTLSSLTSPARGLARVDHQHPNDGGEHASTYYYAVEQAPIDAAVSSCSPALGGEDFDEVTLKEWMWSPAGLGLSICSLRSILYARIYATCAKGKGAFLEPRETTARALGTSRESVCRAASFLEDAGLVRAVADADGVLARRGAPRAVEICQEAVDEAIRRIESGCIVDVENSKGACHFPSHTPDALRHTPCNNPSHTLQQSVTQPDALRHTGMTACGAAPSPTSELLKTCRKIVENPSPKQSKAKGIFAERAGAENDTLTAGTEGRERRRMSPDECARACAALVREDAREAFSSLAARARIINEASIEPTAEAYNFLICEKGYTPEEISEAWEMYVEDFHRSGAPECRMHFLLQWLRLPGDGARKYVCAVRSRKAKAATRSLPDEGPAALDEEAAARARAWKAGGDLVAIVDGFDGPISGPWPKSLDEGDAEGVRRAVRELMALQRRREEYVRAGWATK